MPAGKPHILNYSASAPAQLDWLLPVAIGVALLLLCTLGIIVWAAHQAGC